MLGRALQSPFASPPFRGLSSSRVNVLWGLCNVAVAYTLLAHVGNFEPRRALDASAFGLGLVLAAMSLRLKRGVISGTIEEWRRPSTSSSRR